MKNLIKILILLSSINIHAQWCNVPNQDFCPGNYFTNGNFETLTGNPAPAQSNDINLATGWFPIWGAGSLADLFCPNSGINPFAFPTNATDVYAGMWIQNTNQNVPTFREGMYNLLNTPINSNSGIYSFNFDTAAQSAGTAGNDVVVGVFGVYNPNNIIANNPTSMFTPTDYNLWPTGSGVVVYKLGSVAIPASAINSFVPNTITFNSSLFNASPNITHIMITRDDVIIAEQPFRRRYIAFDNFCLRFDKPTVNNDGAYCCPETENLIDNGNFENNNNGFQSSYTYQSIVAPNIVAPGQYAVVNIAEAATISPQWQVQDHTFCIDGYNSDVMVVNGKTQQPSGTSSVVYRKSVVLESGEYKLCLNAKNLPQCTFDIIPQIRIEILGGNFTGDSPYQGGWINVNTTSDVCDWLNINACVRADGEKFRINIHLLEDGNGDGNDLAFDDISIQKKLESDTFITVQNQGNSPAITASINTISNSDDVIIENEACEIQDRYYWFVYEVSSYPLSGPLANITPGTFSWSSNVSFTTPFTAALPLTTTFPNYIFDNNKLYAIGIYIPSCCNSCYEEKWLYQLTFNFRNQGNPVLTEEMKENIKEHFVLGSPLYLKENIKVENIKIYPNPSQDIFNINFSENRSGTIQVTDLTGKVIFTKKITDSSVESIDLSNHSTGVYIMKFDNGNESFTEKLIKK